MTYSEQDTDDAFVSRVRERFGDAGLVELTALIGFENFSSKFNHALSIAEQQFCPLPAVHGAPDDA